VYTSIKEGWGREWREEAERGKKERRGRAGRRCRENRREGDKGVDFWSLAFKIMPISSTLKLSLVRHE
jgi:hypothetical protein